MKDYNMTNEMVDTMQSSCIAVSKPSPGASGGAKYMSEGMVERLGEAYELDEQLTVIGRRLQTGETAPDFTLDRFDAEASAVGQVRLADSTGKVRRHGVTPAQKENGVNHGKATYDHSNQPASGELTLVCPSHKSELCAATSRSRGDGQCSRSVSFRSWDR
jgi:hypothetical protein